MLSPIQQLILGIIQGITEWLPISSSAMIALVSANFFQITDMNLILKSALFLHLGTFLAALFYFRKEVYELIETAFKYKYSDEKNKKTLKFILISSLITGIIGLIVLQLFTSFQTYLEFTGKTITFVVGIFLLFTGIIQIKIKSRGLKEERKLNNKDSIALGIVQGLATLPGISRAGITTSTLLLKKFDDTTALRLSFLMSLPVVLLGNIALNLKEFTLTNTAIYGLLSAFLFGLLTIHSLMKISKKINFGWFVLIFAGLMILSVLI